MAYSLNVIDRADEVAALVGAVDPTTLQGIDRLTRAYVLAVTQALPVDAGVIVQVSVNAKAVNIAIRRAPIGARTPYAL